MLSLIAAVLLGLIFAFFATQNIGGVNVRFAGYEWANIPLYLVAVGSLLFGMLVSWVISTLDSIGTMLTIRGKDSEIHRAERSLGELKDKIYELELENARLKGEKVEPRSEVDIYRKPNLFDKIRHSFST